MTHERRNQIIEMVQKNRMVNNKELMEKFHISIETVRRDLKYLEEQGYLKCVYGGAIQKQAEETWKDGLLEYGGIKKSNAAEKDAIARAAAKLIKTGDTVFLDEGSTVFAMSRYLHNIERLTVITNSLRTAIAISELPSCTVMIPGGILQSGSLTVTGFQEEGGLNRFNIDKAFVGVVGITETHFTDYPTGTGYLRHQAMQMSEKTIALADYSKFGVHAAMNVSRIEELDVVITNSRTSEKYLELMREAGVQVIVAD